MTAASEFVCDGVHDARNPAIGPRVTEVGRDVQDAEAVRGVDWRSVLYGGIAMAMALLVYVNALHNPFVYDDYHTVITNASIVTLTNLGAIVMHDVTRPLVNVSYAVDRVAWGPGSFGFHLTNVLLHALNVALFAAVVRKMRLGRGAAFAASTLFAVHPIMTEAVGYISGRSEVLCAAFFLVALLCADVWIRTVRRRWFAAMVAAWLAAVMSKETAAMFPFAVLAYDALARPNDAGRVRRTKLVYLPWIVVTALLGVVRLFVLVRIEYPGQAAWHWSFLLIDADVFRRYLGMLVIPNGQALFHEVAVLDSVWRFRALADLGVVAAMLAVAWRVRRLNGFASFGLVWFMLLLVPSAVLIAFNQGEPMTEHRLYLASMGLLFVAGVGIDAVAAHLRGKPSTFRYAAAAVAGIVIFSFSVETLQRNAIWRSPIALWQESVNLAPRHPRPRLLLAESLQDAGRWDEAIEQCQIAVQLRPTDPTAHVALGRALAFRGQWVDARAQFQEAMRLDPRSVSAQRAIATLERVQGQLIQ